MIALLCFLTMQGGVPPYEEWILKLQITACSEATDANVGFLHLTVPRPPGVILDGRIRALRTYVPWRGEFLGPWRKSPTARPARLYYLGAKSCAELKGKLLTASFAVRPCLPNDISGLPEEPPFDCSRVLVPPTVAPSP